MSEESQGSSTGQALQRATTATRTAIVGIVIASIAAAASTVQSFISWSARDDHLETVLLSEVIERCASLRVSLPDHVVDVAALLTHVGPQPPPGFDERGMLDILTRGQALVGDLAWLTVLAAPRHSTFSEEFSNLVEGLGTAHGELAVELIALLNALYDGAGSELIARFTALNGDVHYWCNQFVVEFLD